MKSVDELIEILGASEDEVLSALLTAFSPPQPSALSGAWKQRKNYKNPPTGKEMWRLFEDADFRCTKCGSQHRITLDHKDKNSNDSSANNLQVLCFGCNRATGKGIARNKNSGLLAYRVLLKYFREHEEMPTRTQVAKMMGHESVGSYLYLLAFLQHRLGKPERLKRML